MTDIQELKNRMNITWGAFLAWSVGLAIVVWIAAEIFFEFQHLKRETTRIDEGYKKEIVRVEGRLDKITKRNAETIKGNTDDIIRLKLPNSDK